MYYSNNGALNLSNLLDPLTLQDEWENNYIISQTICTCYCFHANCIYAMQPPQLESNYEMEETFWEPASTYEEVYQQIIDKNKEKLRMASGGVTLLEKLGEGEFGMVHKGEWVGSPQGPLQVAVKSLHSQEEESRYKLLKEAALLGQFSHPNVVKMLGVVVSDEQVSKISIDSSCALL